MWGSKGSTGVPSSSAEKQAETPRHHEQQVVLGAGEGRPGAGSPPTTPRCRRPRRAAPAPPWGTRGCSSTRTSASPAWVASPPKRSGRSMGVIMAPKPPLDFPWMPRWRGRVEGAVVGVDERHHVVAEIGVVPTGARRVHELRPPVRGPGVHPHHDARRRLARGEHGVGGLGERLVVGVAIGPHGEVPGVALDDVDRRQPFGALVVAGRHVHPQGPFDGIPERGCRAARPR